MLLSKHPRVILSSPLLISPRVSSSHPRVTLSSPQASSPLVSRVPSIRSTLANRCGSVPFPTEVVQSIPHVNSKFVSMT